MSGPVVGTIGALAAEAALALLAGHSPYGLGAGLPLGQLLIYEGLARGDGGATRTVGFRRNPRCLACGAAPLAELPAQSAYEVPAC